MRDLVKGLAKVQEYNYYTISHLSPMLSHEQSATVRGQQNASVENQIEHY